MIDTDGDGLSDQYEEKIGTEAYLSDTDGDGVKDGIEVGKNLDKPRNTDNDKRIDALDYDDDNDGLPTFLESKVDTDKDGKKDYLDTDSDNDGMPDGEEAGILNQDKNRDGIDDAFDVDRVGAIDNNGDGIDDNLKLPDHNNDGKPDYLDARYKKETSSPKPKVLVNKGKPKKSKNKIEQKTIELEKVIAKKVEKTPVIEKPKKVVVNRHTDSDNDGLLDSQEAILGTNPLKRDSDGDKVSDAIEIGMDINSPQDSDHDSIIDALDEDDDNDGILSRDEDINKDSTAINDDTDGDGVPNYLDANDDGDDRLTKDEGASKDTDGDGIPDYLDANDNVKNTSQMLASKGTPQKTNKEPEVVVLYDGNSDSAKFNEEVLDENVSRESSEIALNELKKNNTFETEEQPDNQTSKGAHSSLKESKVSVAKSPWVLF